MPEDSNVNMSMGLKPRMVKLTKEETDKLQEDEKQIKKKLEHLEEVIKEGTGDGSLDASQVRRLNDDKKDLEDDLKKLKDDIIKLKIEEAEEEIRILEEDIEELGKPGRQVPQQPIKPKDGKDGEDGKDGGGGSGNGCCCCKEEDEEKESSPANGKIDLSNLPFVVSYSNHDVWVWNPFTWSWGGHLVVSDDIITVEKVDGLAIVRTKDSVWVWNPWEFDWTAQHKFNDEIMEVKDLGSKSDSASDD